MRHGTARPGAGVWVSAGLLAAALLAGPAAAKGPKPIARGAQVSEAAIHVARAMGFARVGLARPETTEPVRFVDASAVPRARGALVRGGFGLGSYSALTDEPIAGQGNVRLATGLLGHQDLFGRTEWSDFVASYVTKGKRVTIHRGHVAPYYPLVPTVRFVFVPVAEAPKDFLDRRYTSVSLLRFLYEAGVPPSELAPGDHYVVAVFLDRLQKKAKVRFVVGPHRDGTAGKGKAKAVVSEDGWFALARKLRVDPAEPTWLKAVVVPQKGSAILASRLSTGELTK